MTETEAKPVRQTVDLPHELHTRLGAWRVQTAGEIRQARVTNQDVLRALVVRLLGDEALSAQIRADLQAPRRSRICESCGFPLD